MSIKHQLALAKTSSGRIVLHIISYFRDKKLGYHFRGIKREFAY